MQLEQLQARRNAATSLKQSSPIPPYSGPPCCGTGCAVCVLDYWEPDELESPEREISGAGSNHGHESHPCNNTNELTQSDPLPNRPDNLPDSLPVCCGTGCAVCVLDYPEYFSEQKFESETLAMLEAIEQAERQAERLIADQTGDSR
ncbi:MAG: hypothetical protein AB7U82_02585 [Blastocatellales bacterium]